MSARAWFAGLLLLCVTAVRPAWSLPSYAAQTGQPCVQCHIGAIGPQLTPFGRAFKIGGYTQTGGEGLAAQIPLAVLVQSSFNHTGADQPAPPLAHFGNNDNFALDQITLFLAGRINDYAGTFVQATYSGTNPAVKLDNSDVRVTAPFDLGGTELRAGISLNNAPTVQDAFNSTPVWAFPFAVSSLAPTPAAQPVISGALAGRALGITVYGWYDRRLYFEVGGYETYGPSLLRLTGTTIGSGATSNIAPYARVAYEWNWSDQSAHIGALLFSANINPAISSLSASGSMGRNRFTDYAFDAGYQFLGTGRHIFTVDGSFTHEDQSLKGAFNTGGSSQVSNSLDQIRVAASYFFENTYGLTVGWQSTFGTPNPLLFAPTPVTGSRNGKPNTDSFIIEADWVPFGKADSWGNPFANLKIGAQYIAYTRFNGSATNYDGFGRNASDNNTFYLYLWLVF